jgi:hypothetical protein
MDPKSWFCGKFRKPFFVEEYIRRDKQAGMFVMIFSLEMAPKDMLTYNCWLAGLRLY